MADPDGARHLEGESAHELLAAVATHAGAELRQVHLRSVHHRAGRSVSHVYETVLRIDGQDQHVLLVAHADRRPLPDGVLQLERDGDRVAVWRFPHDPYLHGLPSATDPGRVRELLDHLDVPEGDVSLHTRAYRPSRRAVVEVTIHTRDAVGRVLYLKVLAGNRADELAEIHRALCDHAPVPRVIGVAPDQGILALEALEGRTLREVLVDGHELPEVGAVVGVSRRFATRGLRTRRDPREFADPARHVSLLAGIAPEMASDVKRIAAHVAQLDGPLVGVHGDFHDGQLLVQDGDITGVLDVDGTGIGLLVQDVGNLIAHVEVVGVLWPEAADRCDYFAQQLRGAYLDLVGSADLAVATAGAWLGLATGPHRAQEPGWPQNTRDRIERALQHLGR